MAGDRLQVLRLPDRVGHQPLKDVNELAQIERGQEIFADLVLRRLSGLRAPPGRGHCPAPGSRV